MYIQLIYYHSSMDDSADSGSPHLCINQQAPKRLSILRLKHLKSYLINIFRLSTSKRKLAVSHAYFQRLSTVTVRHAD